MKFKVTALSVNLTVLPHIFTEPREEIVDTSSNPVFSNCGSIRDVEIAYEDLWNYGSSQFRIEDAASKVKVLSVTPLLTE
jgi:hypothetical protein